LHIFDRSPARSHSLPECTSDLIGGGFSSVRSAILSSVLKKTAADNLAKPGGERVSDPVKNPLAVFAALEHTGLQQEAQVFGDVGLRGSGEFHDFAHVPWGVADGLEDAQARGFAEDLENGGDPDELLWGKVGLFSGLTHENITIQ
jgi:hypothetical protein